MPITYRTTPEAAATPAGMRKFRFRLLVEALRHASKGPTPVRNNRKIAMGTFTRLKKGAPTVILLPLYHSERTGNIVPHRTAKHETSRRRLLNRKLLSLDTTEPIWLSGFR